MVLIYVLDISAPNIWKELYIFLEQFPAHFITDPLGMFGNIIENELEFFRTRVVRIVFHHFAQKLFLDRLALRIEDHISGCRDGDGDILDDVFIFHIYSFLIVEVFCGGVLWRCFVFLDIRIGIWMLYLMVAYIKICFNIYKKIVSISLFLYLYKL